MKKIFLVLFLLVFCAYSQNDSDKNQSAEISGSMKAPSIKEAKKACENKEKNACITAVSMMLSEANSSADELKEAYKLAQIDCDINVDMSCVLYSQALLFGIFEDENINEGLKTLEHSCQNGGAMSCANLSDIYFFGHFSQNKDEQKAKLYLDKICEKRKDFCPMAKSMEQSHAQISQSKIAVPPQNLWLSQNLVREKSLKTYELGEVPDGVALDIIHFLTGTQEKLVCDELPLILALARNNDTEPLQERIYGISGGELMELFRTYKISPKIAEIFTK